MLQPAEIRGFQANLHGELIQPYHDRYEEARKVFNGMIDNRRRSLHAARMCRT